MKCGDLKYVQLTPVTENNRFVPMSTDKLINHYLDKHSDDEFVDVKKLENKYFLVLKR